MLRVCYKIKMMKIQDAKIFLLISHDTEEVENCINDFFNFKHQAVNIGPSDTSVSAYMLLILANIKKMCF